MVYWIDHFSIPPGKINKNMQRMILFLWDFCKYNNQGLFDMDTVTGYKLSSSVLFIYCYIYNIFQSWDHIYIFSNNKFLHVLYEFFLFGQEKSDFMQTIRNHVFIQLTNFDFMALNFSFFFFKCSSFSPKMCNVVL